MLEYYRQYKTVGFVGCGVSNMPIIKLFANDGGFDVVVRNKTEEIPCREELGSRGVKFICGEDHLDGIFEDIVFLSPVVHQDLPQIEQAKKNGTVFTTEMQEFISHCKGTVIGITGSDGKTTTSTIISLLLKEAGYNVYLGGNIGENLFMKLDEIKETDFAVVELSSFQLMKTTAVPDIAVITNVSPNHLDWHKDMAEYIYAKSRIYNKTKTKLLVLNGDDKVSEGYDASGINVRYTSHTKMLEKGASYNDKGIFYNGELYVKDGDVLLPGVHNRANYSAAYCAVADHVTKEQLQKVCREFKGVEHRIELVREVDGVKYYNSSIDTSPTRSKAALVSFKQRVIVIAGGYDKHLPVDILGDVYLEKTKAIVTMGQTSPLLNGLLDSIKYPYPRFDVKTMEEAVEAARSVAGKGDIIILSPAAASFDLYKNFASRGNHFKDIVNSIK